LAFILCNPSWSAPAEQPLPAEVATALARARVPRDAVSFVVAPVDGQRAPRLAHRARVEMNPASVMKLVTTYAALDLLGADYTWNTRFYADGPVSNGVLQGNLYVRGGGDPKLVLERIDETFKALQARGVQQVRGDMVLDHSYFEPINRDPAEFDGEPLRPYNSTPDALLVNFKSLIFTLTPDAASKTASIKSEPPIAGVLIDTNVPLSSQPCGDWRASLQADFTDPNRVRFTGPYPASCGERVWPVAYADPASYSRRVLQAMFTAAGGSLDGSARDGIIPTQARWLMDTPSLPLSDIIADVNKFSNNVMAQQLYLTLSAKSRGVGTLDGSRAILNAWCPRAVSADAPVPNVENGSGLSRDEHTSANALATLLQRAARHPQAAVFANSLAVAGVDGTVSRMGAQAGIKEALGNAQLKTGSLRDVASVAGYVTGRSGQRYVVVGIVNHPLAGAARPALNALVEWAAKDQQKDQ
jgi:D-alanyl-D-alanine carboxypeptidase/D-alanyl-D-alanine-endopeptidase (penicillin-binding protein 4)